VNKRLIIGGITAVIVFSLLIAMVTNSNRAVKKSPQSARILMEQFRVPGVMGDCLGLG